MDARLRAHIEQQTGLPFESCPETGADLHVSPKRTDVPGNRLLAVRVADRDGILVTGIQRVVDVLTRSLPPIESVGLFAPAGLAKLRRTLDPTDACSLDREPSVRYTIEQPASFRPHHAGYTLSILTRKDIPRTTQEFQLCMSERDTCPPEDLAWAFVCCQGKDQVAIAVLRWDNARVGAISIAGTKEPYQRRGYGRAVVSAATQYILEKNCIPKYGTVQSHAVALRMIRPLGYRLAYQSIQA